MATVDDLIKSYGKYIDLPWSDNIAASQRVIFCIYDPKDERKIRLKAGEFALVTQQTNHNWALFDLTDTFAQWLSVQKYAESYYQEPQNLSSLIPKYLEYIAKQFEDFLRENQVDNSFVVALQGLGSIFGFAKVKNLVERLAPLFGGRLLVFFPGSFENNNYRLLDAYDGWNYLAIPITGNDIG